jgi:hypothetical protein
MRNAVRLHASTAERPVQNRDAERQNRAKTFLHHGATLLVDNPFIGVARLARSMGLSSSSREKRTFSKNHIWRIPAQS